MSVLQIVDLKKDYGEEPNTTHALKGIQFEVDKGEFVGIMGASGSGKTTLLNCISTIDTATDGHIYLDGKDILEIREKDIARFRRESLGFIFQDFNLLDTLTIEENIALALTINKVSANKIDSQIQQIAAKLNITDILNKYPYQVSGGQKQRVAIARALASDPQILLCDEATSALDPQTTSSILALLQDINKRFGITIVVITHQMAVVREICNRVAIMKDGQVVENGSTVEIFNHPKSEVARELLRKDDGGDTTGDDQQTASQIQDGTKIRIVFTENSAFEPVIANMILTFKEPINILKAATKNVGGVAKGEMILEIPNGSTNVKAMEQYLIDRGLEIEELSEIKTGGAF